MKLKSSRQLASSLCSQRLLRDSTHANKKVPESFAGNLKYHIKNIALVKDLRIDIFVLPKEISAKDLLNSTISCFYTNADIELFNTIDGGFKWMENDSMKIVENIDGNDIILRTVTRPCDMFKNVENTFSLIIHNPNFKYNSMLNRLVVEFNEGENIDVNSKEFLGKAKLLKDVYEEE